jgi:ribosomal protein S18 acetylase RimI-like enzyme
MAIDTLVHVREIRHVPEELDRARDAVLRAYEGVLGDHFDPGYQAHMAAIEERATSATVLVGLVEGLIVGCATYVSEANSPYGEGLLPGESSIRMLGVLPEFEGRGVGRALTLECIARSERDGREALFLFSNAEFVRAHGLYLSLGFARCEARDFHLEERQLHLYAFRLSHDRPTFSSDSSF